MSDHSRIRGVEFVVGQRGTGKSTYIRTEVIPAEPRVLVYDHMAEYIQAQGVWNVTDADLMFDALDGNKTGFCRVVYAPLHRTAGEFDLMCLVPRAYPGLTLVCDELDMFARPFWPPEPFRQLIHFGRHFGSSFVGASRRPADVSRAFTSQAKTYTVFRVTEPNDLRFLRSVLGDGVLRAKDLPDLHYLKFEGSSCRAGVVRPGA